MKINLRVHFYDTDTMGVVHHSNYIRWFETGRVEFLRTLGIDLNEMLHDGILFPIVEIQAKYLIRRAGQEKILVEGFSRNVFTDAVTGKICKLPEKYFSKLNFSE